jgi:ankyrin repeat protein
LDDSVDEDNANDIPLVTYAARHWFEHAGSENVASRIRDAMEYFFDDKPHWTAWSRVQMVDERWHGFSPNKVDDAFPLYYASLGGFYDLAEHLIGKHPEHINASGGQMVTPLVAALHGKHIEVAELLHQHGADVDVRGDSGYTPLHQACSDVFLENLDTVEWLLNRGADVNVQNSKLYTPLHNAIDRGHLQIFQKLIEHHADIHIRNDDGESPLHIAASPGVQRSRVDIMQVLLDHGADLNARDDGGSTPLHSSSWCKGGLSSGTVGGMRLLLKHGAAIDAEDNEGRTPLQLALEHGRGDIATFLTGHGAYAMKGKFPDRYLNFMGT